MLYFYQPKTSEGVFHLMDDEYQHCVKVLRKKVGDEIGIFDGLGMDYHAVIKAITGKSCAFEITKKTALEPRPFYNHIAIAPTKNTDRIEWFVEKACELGLDEISFVLTDNCERNKMRTERLEKKAVSALKQSKSGFLTKINPLIKLKDFLKADLKGQKFMAVVEPDLPYFTNELKSGQTIITLIGPEGDFSKEEVSTAVNVGFQKVSLGKSTLRTETAGLMAAHCVNVINEY
ncbi:RsmE family RNA methyltransferase [Marinoscillum sp.]|uniref:RsmE family RNA methyltransferase n=1 Tax=Marinoscillum sp. TaxID=2024838 RepID=UPI003BAA3A02